MNFAQPIKISERIKGLETFSNQGTLLKDEKTELLRQGKKMLEPTTLSRLTPDEIKKLKKVFETIASTHGVTIRESKKIKNPTLLECVQSLRNRAEMHTDSEGLWDNEKNGATKNSFGITVRYYAYTIFEFYDDLERLLTEIKSDQKANNSPDISPKLKWPIILSLKQLIDSATKGSMSKDGDYSSIIKKSKALLEKI